MQIYELGPEGREKLGQKAKDYVNSEFSIQSTVDTWDKTLTNVINNWREKRKSWSVEEV